MGYLCGQQVAVAAATDAHGYEVVAGSKVGRQAVEGVGVPRQSMHHDDRRRPGLAPLQVVQVEVANPDESVCCLRGFCCYGASSQV